MKHGMCSHLHACHNRTMPPGLTSHLSGQQHSPALTLPSPQQQRLGSGCQHAAQGLDSTASLGGPGGQQAALATHLMLEAKGVPKLSSEQQGLRRMPFLCLPRSSSLSVQGASVAELVPESGSK